MVRIALLWLLSSAALAADPALYEREADLIDETVVQAIYEQSVAELDSAIAEQPGDILLHLQRCKIAQRFSYVDETYMAKIEAAAEACFEALEAQFAGHPELHLALLDAYRVGNRMAYAKDLHDNLRGWNSAQHARLHVILADLHRYENEQLYNFHCARALELDEATPCRLAASAYYRGRGEIDQAVSALVSPLAEDPSFHASSERIIALTEMGEYDLAASLWEAIRGEPLEPYVLVRLAPSLQEAGLVEDARQALADVPDDYWDDGSVLGARYRMAVNAGDYGDALTIYEQLRDNGLSTDPVLRIRAELALHDWTLPWQWRDFLGLLVIGGVLLIILIFAMATTGVVHYRGLVRRLQGKAPGWPAPPWRLGHLIYALSVLAIAAVSALYIAGYEYLFETVDTNLITPSLGMSQILVVQIWLEAFLTLPLLVSRHARRMLFSPGFRYLRWFGLALLTAFGLRVLFGLPVIFFPDAFASAQIGTTSEAIAAAYRSYGFWPILLLVAFVVPVVEEVLFRGVMLTSIGGQISFAWANLLQSLLFAAMHDSLLLVPWYVAFGLIAGWLTRRSGSLLPAILTHMLFNGAAFAAIVLSA